MLERRGSASAGQQRAESGQGDLAVHGRERAALRCEARELLADHITLRLIGDHVAVRRRISRYGRINVKAIDRGVGVGGPGLAAYLPPGAMTVVFRSTSQPSCCPGR